jgi:hypothetical protein
LPLPEFKHWIDMVVLKNKLAWLCSDEVPLGSIWRYPSRCV